MTQLDDGHDLLHAQNKDKLYKERKLKFLEDRIEVLEKTLESHAKILARFQMTEGNKS